MARKIAFLLLAAVCSSLSQQTTTFQSGVALVHVDTQVADSDNRIITGLAKDDFRVFDEGKEQRIVSLLSEEQPLDLILLFDISASMRGIVQQVASAADLGLSKLQTGDRVSVMVFNTKSRVVAPFSDDLKAVQGSIQKDLLAQRFGGGTAIQASVDDAAQRFVDEPQSERRRAVLIITDNIGIRTRQENSVVRDFWRADALLSGLIMQDSSYKKAHTINEIIAPQTLLLEAGMKGIARKTGGDAIGADAPGPAFADMMHRIRTRYSLYYRMPNAKSSQTRTIKVELSAAAQKRYPQNHIHARHGYIVPNH